MPTKALAIAAALLLIPAALAMTTQAVPQGDREATCVQHVRTSGVPGAVEAAADVCRTDYIKRYTR